MKIFTVNSRNKQQNALRTKTPIAAVVGSLCLFAATPALSLVSTGNSSEAPQLPASMQLAELDYPPLPTALPEQSDERPGLRRGEHYAHSYSHSYAHSYAHYIPGMDAYRGWDSLGFDTDSDDVEGDGDNRGDDNLDGIPDENQPGHDGDALDLTLPQDLRPGQLNDEQD